MSETLHEALVKVQSALKAPKNQKNTFGNYNYRNCEDILEAVKPLLRENGLTLNLSDEIVCAANRVYIQATATVSNGVENQSSTALAREPETKKGMDDSQITGATSSYARKYALNGLLCIDDTRDADTDAYQQQTKGAAGDPPQQPEDYPICADCCSPIQSTLINGVKYAPEKIAKASEKTYGVALCYHCKLERDKSANKA